MLVEENKLAKITVNSAFDIHRELGPGLLESAYEEYLMYELVNQGLEVERQKPLPLIYKDIKLDCGYRLDLLVENKLIIEIKAIKNFEPVHMAQVLTYLKLTKLKLGLLINFNVKYIKTGLKRVIL